MIPTLKKPNTLLFILLLAPFVRPLGLDYFPLIGKILTLWKLLALVYLVPALLPTLVQPHPKKSFFPFIGLAVFWAIYLIGCVRVGKDVVSIFTAGASSILLLLLISYETRIGNGMLLLKAMAQLFTFYLLAHIATVFLANAGLLWLGYVGESLVYLFGMDNYSAFFLYPMLSIVLYYDCLRRGHLTLGSWLLTFAVVGVYLLTKSLTAAAAGVFMLPFLMIMGYWKTLPKIKGVRWIICGMAIFLILVCGFQAQNLLAPLLNKTSKGVTLNSRTYIWDYALKLIGESPLFGHGTFTDKELFTDYVLYGVDHAHNLLLELLLRAGIAGAAGFLVFLFGFAPIGKRRPVPKAHGILLIGLAGQLLLCFMDFYPTILPFYIFMGVLYCSHRFCPMPPESAEKPDTSEVPS